MTGEPHLLKTYIRANLRHLMPVLSRLTCGGVYLRR